VVGGLGLGAFLCWALVRASDSAGTGAFAVPHGQLAVVLLVGLVAGRRAARLDVLRAIAAE
jgi:putative ABC transport system permease protein